MLSPFLVTHIPRFRFNLIFFPHLLQPEFATCEAKTEPFRTPFCVANMRISLCLLGL